MRPLLILLFSCIFVFMVGMTAHTQMQVSFWDFAHWQPQYASNPWAMATLWDAYFGFITFFVWVCYKERSIMPRIVWFVLIMALEKNVRWGKRISAPLGVVLIAAGIAIALLGR